MNNSSISIVLAMQHLNGTLVYDPKLFWSSLSIWFSVLLIICIFGSVSNFILLFVIVSHKRLRSGCGILIGHLIATYLLMCSIHFPIYGFMLYGRNFWFTLPNNICKYVHYLQVISLYASNWTEACLAINRWIAIVFPHHYPAWTTLKVCLTMVTFCWVFSIVTILPFCFDMVGLLTASAKIGQCVLLARGYLGNLILMFNSYMPYAVVGVASLTIFAKILRSRILSQSRRAAVCHLNNARLARLPEQQLLAKRLNVARVLLISFLFCVLCNLPIPITASFFGAVFNRSPLLNIWLRICLLSQYAFNPVSKRK
jgi:hypothetical protein